MRSQKLDVCRALTATALSCVACSGGDYWLGGGAGPGASIPPGAIELGQDTVLSGGESVEIGGGTESCRIFGNGHRIVSQGTFSGNLWIHDCAFTGLGSEQNAAIDVEVSNPGSVIIERSTFAASGAIQITNSDDTATTFQNNVVYDDSVVTLGATADATTPAFQAFGASQAQKLFQGNRIYRSDVWLGSPNWLVGGDTDAQSNLLIGVRAGIFLSAGGQVVRGNYVHDEHLAVAGDESSLDADYSVTDTLAEHNVLRRGAWVVRGFGGEFRYNVVLDADNLSFFQQPFENTHVHHNLFVMCEPAIDGAIQGGLQVVNARAVGIEIYNNTFDGGGAAIGFGGPAISVDADCLLASLRSNLFANFSFAANAGDAAIRPGATESSLPMPARLGYADYNLFDNQSQVTLRNYGLSVDGKNERTDPGFALNDANAGGPLDQQVMPNLTGAPNCFAFSDDDIRAGKVTVSQMLTALRDAYTPLPGSPPLGAGDPQDGAGNFIGAVGDGALAADLFGRFGP
ncbi:MAG TPA: hypothetical protein VGM29_16555 [Polyangiaceae bacterium]|jgi:hypothetical protein